MTQVYKLSKDELHRPLDPLPWLPWRYDLIIVIFTCQNCKKLKMRQNITLALFTLRMSSMVRHGKWHILHLILCLCNCMSDHHKTLYSPAMFHTATVRPKRLEPGLLYNTSLSLLLKLTEGKNLFLLLVFKVLLGIYTWLLQKSIFGSEIWCKFGIWHRKSIKHIIMKITTGVKDTARIPFHVRCNSASCTVSLGKGWWNEYEYGVGTLIILFCLNISWKKISRMLWTILLLNSHNMWKCFLGHPQFSDVQSVESCKMPLSCISIQKQYTLWNLQTGSTLKSVWNQGVWGNSMCDLKQRICL